MYMNQYWKDERLAFSSTITEDNMTLTGDFADKIWVPDTFFANDKRSFLHDVTERNKMVRLHRDGSIEYSMRFTTTLACVMDLHNYPLDVQTCSIDIESYGYPMQDIIMQWKGDNRLHAVHGVNDLEIPQFSIEDFKIATTVETSVTGSYQRLSLSFKLKRNFGYFIFQTYLPSILIVMLSWVSFWINHEATSARVALGITTVLTMTTISTGVRSSLPRISYVKAIDIYLVVCFVFVFAALLEYAAVNYRFWGARARHRSKYLKQQRQRERTQMQNESFEMEEERWSPILSLRHRLSSNTSDNALQQQSQTLTHSVDECLSSYLPFRMHAVVPRYRFHVRAAGLLHMSHGKQSVLGSFKKRKQILYDLKKKEDRIKRRLPTFIDVNQIDKCSRLAFPSLFLVFNICYWCFYILQ